MLAGIILSLEWSTLLNKGIESGYRLPGQEKAERLNI
jgi:hypothetical protein